MIVLSGLSPKTYQVTPQGMQALQAQLEDLKRRRRDAAEAIREITSQTTDMGARVDSTFAASRNDASELDADISLLERIIALADVVDTSRHDGSIRVGSSVTVRLGDEKRSYRLVGALEADPIEGRISDESPLGRSLLGKRAGEAVDILTPGGTHTPAEVLQVE